MNITLKVQVVDFKSMHIKAAAHCEASASTKEG